MILLQKQILSNYIEIKVNKEGEQLVLSNDFTGTNPSIYIDDVLKTTTESIIQVDSISSKIRLQWNNPITNFAYMFSNLKNIAEVNISNLIDEDSKFYYTFNNCINLKKFTIDISYNIIL